MFVERRLRPDRRRGFDRRIGGRRFEALPVSVERRRRPDRRAANRRTLLVRRAARVSRSSP